MVFFVYLDPPVFAAAAQSGHLGLDALAAVLRAFLQNCVLLDFEDWRWETGVRRALDAHESTFEQSLIKKLLVQLKKRNRLAPCLHDDYSGETDLSLVLSQAAQRELDLILSQSDVAPSSHGQCEITKLETYQRTAFEEKREKAATHGREYSGGEFSEREFLARNFRKALRFAVRVEICDALLGRKFADNYDHTLKLLLGFMDEVLVERQSCELTIHCEQSDRNHHLLTRIAAHRPAGLSNLMIKAVFYSPSNDHQCLPHERYLATNQFGFVIGRGMDFLDRSTGKNRDCSLNLKDHMVVDAKLRPFVAFARPPVIV